MFVISSKLKVVIVDCGLLQNQKSPFRTPVISTKGLAMSRMGQEMSGSTGIFHFGVLL
jgi:hypothetical protein